MIMARWFIKQFLHCRPGLQTELGNLHSAAIQYCCHRNRRDGTILQHTKITSHDFTRKLNVWHLIHSACVETSTMLSYSTSHNSKLLQQPASGSQIGTQTLIGTGNSKLKLATARVSDKQALLQEGRMGLHYNMQNCYNSSKFLLMIHQKTECITSDLQHICGNHYNVVMGVYYSTSCNNCFATTASLRFADW